MMVKSIGAVNYINQNQKTNNQHFKGAIVLKTGIETHIIPEAEKVAFNFSDEGVDIVLSNLHKIKIIASNLSDEIPKKILNAIKNSMRSAPDYNDIEVVLNKK